MDIRPPSHIMAWLGPLLIVNLFVWIVIGVPEANDVFCSGTSNCFVTWVSALSGWAAALATLLTLLFLVRQHYDNLLLHLAPKKLLARRAKVLADHLRTRTVGVFFATQWLQGKTEIADWLRAGLEADLVQAEETINHPDLLAYSHEIAATEILSDEAKLAIRQALDFVRDNDPAPLLFLSESLAERLLQRLERVLETTEQYATFIDQSADDFLRSVR